MSQDFDPMNIRIDDEFRTVLPELGKMEKAELENRLLDKGYDPSLGKMIIWFEPGIDVPVMIDGHNRYGICRKHDIKLSKECFAIADYESREEVVSWIVTTQLSRRNLTDVQKVEIIERFRPQLVERGKRNMSDGGKGSVNSPKVDTRKDLAKMANMGESKYGDIAKVLNSDDDDLKEQLRKGDISAHKAAETVKAKEKKPETREDRIRNNEKTLNRNAEKLAKMQEEMERLHEETERLYCGEDAEIRYEIEPLSVFAYNYGWKVKVFFERGDHRIPLYEDTFYTFTLFPPSEEPDESVMTKCPEERRDDFLNVWKAMRKDLSARMEEAKAYQEAQWESTSDTADKTMHPSLEDTESVIMELREIPVKYRKLAGNLLTKLFHPDSKGTVALPEELRGNIPSEYTKYAITIKKCLATL